MAKPKILISILTDEDTAQIEFGEKLLRHLFSNRLLAPEFASNHEPINQPIANLTDAMAFWPGNPFLCRRKQKIVSQISVYHSGIFGSGAVIFDATYYEAFDWLTLFKELISISKGHYGYLHLITDHERDNSDLSPELVNSFFLGTFAKSINDGITELAWANYFGPQWLEFVDLDALKNYRAQLDSDLGGSLLFVTNCINDVLSDFQKFKKIRRTLKNSFRSGFFRGESEG